MEEKYDWNYRLVRYFLGNRQLTLLLLAIVVLGGLFAFSRFRVEGFPEVPVPVAVVSTVVPGAGPETIDQLVTVPLESALANIKGIKDISSNSSTSVSSIILQFEDEGDSNSVIQEVRSKLASVSVPETARQPDVFVPETGGAPFIVAITGQKSVVELHSISKTYIEDLAQLPGIRSVAQFGNLEEKIYIEIDPEFLSEQLFAQIRNAGVSFPLGQGEFSGKLVPVMAESQVNSIDELRNLIVIVGSPAGPVQKRLGEISNIYSTVDTDGEINRVGFKDGNLFRIQPGILLTVRLDKDADVIKTGNALEERIREIDQKVQGAKGVVVFSQAKDAQRQITEIVEGAVGGKWDMGGWLGNIGYVFGAVWLLIIVMLLFLDWRSAIVSIISIPLSFLTTFLVLNILDIQLNTIVLFSLVLVLGLIVDPAIVVLESIKRYMEVGYKGESAVLRSTKVIGQGVFIAVLTSLLVFIPFGIVSGTFGAIIKYIPLTVIPALLASYFVPMIFLTWLGATFLKARRKDDLVDENDPHTLWRSAQWFIRTNRYIVKRRWLSVLVILLGLVIPIAIAGAFIGTGKIKQVQFAAPPDSEFLLITAPFPPNSTDATRRQENSKLEEVLKEYAGVIQNYYYASLEGMSTNTSLSVFIELLPTKEREQKSPEIADNLDSDLREVFGDQAFAIEISAGPPEESYPVVVRIFDSNPETLRSASSRVAEKLKTYSEVTAVRTDSDYQAEDISIKLDSGKAAEVGVSPQSFYQQIGAGISENTILTLNGTDVVIKKSSGTSASTLDTLRDATIFGTQGQVRAGDIATFTTATVPSSIRRMQGERFAQVSARVNDSRDIIRVQRDIVDWAKSRTAELGVNERAFESRGGGNEFEKSFQELFLAIAVSIVASYIIFVLFFKSLIQPFIILFAIPLIAVGIFPSLVLFANGQLGFLEIIGVIMVIGIVENVGIFLIDFANQKVLEGMDKREAIALASGIRFRPIILTKLTALAGLLPLAVFAPFWRGLAVVVIMGIISSGILSLFTTPILYVWLTRPKS